MPSWDCGCGKINGSDERACSFCGAANYSRVPGEDPAEDFGEVRAGHVLAAVLGFALPLIGLIMGFIRNSDPNPAKRWIARFYFGGAIAAIVMSSVLGVVLFAMYVSR